MIPERYLRQQAVEGFGIERLSRMRVVVVGAGAIGNEVVKNLVLMGVGSIDVHDFDRVELHNLTRSIFLREADVGKGKAGVVAHRAGDVDPRVTLRPFEGDAWRTLQLGELSRADALVAAVDSLEARMRLSQLCLIAGVHFVNAGIDGRHASVDSFAYGRADRGACYECHLPESAYRKIAERYSCGWLRRALFAEAVVPTTAITASVAGALAAQAALRADDGPVARRIFLDTRTGNSSTAILDRNPDCPACAMLTPRPRRVAAGGDWQASLAAHAPEADAVTLSDALIFAHACVRCPAAASTRSFVGRRASDVDDSIMRCSACGELSVRIDVRAEATVDELRRLVGNAPIPAKFLLVNAGEPSAVCIDLEE